MKAFTKYKYGGPEVLKLEEIEKPKVLENHLLLKVKANSANPADWHILRGKPFLARLSFGLFKPKSKLIGADVSGIVEAVGQGVSNFKVGDRVFGEMINVGAFAEYVNISDQACGKMPEESTFINMASIPLAGITAQQALITQGELKKGESVLINGASGGVGHFAVQIAKAHGAKVVAICSSRNKDFVKSLGADKVIAYDKVNIEEYKEQCDLVIDANGNLSQSDYKRLGKRGVMVGFTTMGHMLSVLFKNGFSKFQIKQFTAKANSKDLEILSDYIKSGKIQPHIEKIYPYKEIPQAIEHIESMRTRGKVVMSWSE